MTTLTMVRSDTFTYKMRLNQSASDPWTWPSFTSLRFTIREAVPTEAIVDDAGAMLSVDETYFDIIDDEWARITVPKTMTNLTPGRFKFDVQGIIAGTPDIVKTLDSGPIIVHYDITRTNA